MIPRTAIAVQSSHFFDHQLNNKIFDFFFKSNDLLRLKVGNIQIVLFIIFFFLHYIRLE